VIFYSVQTKSGRDYDQGVLPALILFSFLN